MGRPDTDDYKGAYAASKAMMEASGLVEWWWADQAHTYGFWVCQRDRACARSGKTLQEVNEALINLVGRLQ